MIYLDTQVVVRMFTAPQLLSRDARQLVNRHDPFVSPAVFLELQFLREIGRIKYSPERILTHVKNHYGVQTCERKFSDVVRSAAEVTWTRDPFDRLIVGQARLNQDALITRDENILEHYKHATW